MRTLLKLALTVLFLSIVVPTPVPADDFYVIPVLKKMKNVVTVAKAGGQYTDVKTAIDSIAYARADNPYLVYIGPGVYTVTSPIQLKAYVTVMGSGREATLLKGALSTFMYDTSAIIPGADNASLAQLSVENTGGGSNSIGVYNDYAAPAMTGITAIASGGSETYGVYNDYSSPAMTDVTAIASGGSHSRGVYNYFSSPVMTNVTAKASGGTYNYAVFNYYSSAVLTNVTATGSGGTASRGVYNWASPSVMMNGVTAEASGGDENYGVYITAPGPTIRNCTLKAEDGTSYGVYGEGTAVLSTVIGGGGGNAVCRGCFDESGNSVDLTCN